MGGIRGDWLTFGERKYGEMYAQALDETDYEYKTLRDAKYVAGKVGLSGRHDNLSFSHHKAVASLAPQEQKQWLDRAEDEGLTRDELRQGIKKSRKLPNRHGIRPILAPCNDLREMRVGESLPLRIYQQLTRKHFHYQ